MKTGLDPFQVIPRSLLSPDPTHTAAVCAGLIGTLVLSVRKCRGKKEPPLKTVDEGLYWAVALGQNSRGRVSEETKGVCEV